MKKYTDPIDYSTLFVGVSKEIKALAEKLCEAGCLPAVPKFAAGKIYGLEMDCSGNCKIRSEATTLAMLGEI